MTDRIASDHDAVDTHRARVAAVGRTGRVQVELPEKLTVADGDVCWVSLSGESGYAQVSSTLAGTPVIQAVRPNRRGAREGDGPDRLQEWLAETGLDAGDAVHLDVLTGGHAYGLRVPGTRAVYAPPDRPDQSLADIARDVSESGQ